MVEPRREGHTLIRLKEPIASLGLVDNDKVAAVPAKLPRNCTAWPNIWGGQPRRVAVPRRTQRLPHELAGRGLRTQSLGSDLVPLKSFVTSRRSFRPSPRIRGAFPGCASL